jgi:hypothetical protein
LKHCPVCREPIRECICPDEDDEMAEGVAQAWHGGGDEDTAERDA